jgi:hypothetical protein
MSEKQQITTIERIFSIWKKRTRSTDRGALLHLISL